MLCFLSQWSIITLLISKKVEEWEKDSIMLLVVLIMLALWMSHLFLYCLKKERKKEIMTTPLNYKGKGIPLKTTLSKDKVSHFCNRGLDSKLD